LIPAACFGLGAGNFLGHLVPRSRELQIDPTARVFCFEFCLPSLDLFLFSLADSEPKGLLLVVGSGAESRTKVLIFVFLTRQSLPVASKFQLDSATYFGRRLLLLFDFVCSASVLRPLLFLVKMGC
jgi:hypothetical protein